MQITMPSMTDPTGAADQPPMTLRSIGSRGPLWPLQRYYGVFARPQTYLNVLYLLLGLPLGIAYFVSLVTLISVSGGLTITLVGIPLFVATMYYWCIVAGVNGRRPTCSSVRASTRCDFGTAQGGSGKRNSIGTRLRSTLTWRSLLWLFLRFPQGIATLTSRHCLRFGAHLDDRAAITANFGGGADFGVWRWTRSQKGLIFRRPGPFAPAGGAYVCNLAARLSGAATGGFPLFSVRAGEPARRRPGDGIGGRVAWALAEPHRLT